MPLRMNNDEGQPFRPGEEADGRHLEIQAGGGKVACLGSRGKTIPGVFCHLQQGVFVLWIGRRNYEVRGLHFNIEIEKGVSQGCDHLMGVALCRRRVPVYGV